MEAMAGRLCCNFRGISLLTLSGKLPDTGEENLSIRWTKIQEEQCGFSSGCRTLYQLFVLFIIFKGSWEFAQPVHMCFVDFEDAIDSNPMIYPELSCGSVFQVYGVAGSLLPAFQSF